MTGMDPVQSWLDAGEVRRMAEGLMEPVPEAGELAPGAGYGEGFEGFTGSSGDGGGGGPGSGVRQFVRCPSRENDACDAGARPEAEGVASGGGILAAGAAVRGPFLSRLKQFGAIIRSDLGARAMFLIDRDGEILLDEMENPELVQAARILANASCRVSRQMAGAATVGNLHVKIGASATLEVIPVESRYGLLVLGAIFPAPLGADRVRQVADVLSRIVEPVAE